MRKNIRGASVSDNTERARPGMVPGAGCSGRRGLGAGSEPPSAPAVIAPDVAPTREKQKEDPMSDLDLARSDPETLLWQELDAVHAGMLGVEGSGQHLQPMAHHIDRERRRLWFFTKRDADLVEAVRPGAMAHFAIISKAQDFHACMSGPIREEKDRAFLEAHWSAPTAAWYEGGKDDPQLVMLALELQHARIWASTRSTLAYAWEIAKANALDQKVPHVGVRADVTFGSA
jgi:general stress protein 26